MGLQVLRLVRRGRGLESGIVLDHAIGPGGLAARRLDVVDGALLQGQPRDVGNMQRLRSALIYFVLRSFEVADEAISITVLVDGGREHDESVGWPAPLVEEGADSLSQ